MHVMHPTLIHCVGTVCRTSRIFLNWFFSRSETSALGLEPCNRFPRLACAQQRGGFSLLEVLVACGILVIGLTSIAAILPAAGARFAEAALYDRAAATANVGMSEVLLKNVASAARAKQSSGLRGGSSQVGLGQPDQRNHDAAHRHKGSQIQHCRCGRRRRPHNCVSNIPV